MCGICGIYCLGNDEVDKRTLHKMNNAIKHRGPDDQGFYIDKKIGLGHRRLSIIDLSKKGKQPMSNEDGNIWIVFNGEIYNYKELRSHLNKHKFKSNTDTEVIIHAYEEWGESFINKLEGMFAFAIWGDQKKSLLLARDRFGKKPLYYFYDRKKFVFGSEIKAILEDRTIKREVNRQALSNFLGLGYVPQPLTMFNNIQKLAQSHYMTITKKGMGIKRYWGIPNRDKIRGSEKEIKILFGDAVKKRLISDVPLGAFLSGGIDSSIIVGVMSKIMKEPVKTFSVGFNDPTDELKYANLVSKKFNTEHKEIIVEYDAFKILPKVIWHLDEPLADPAVLPTYIMSKETKKHISVVLVGEGGDEVFLGYKRYMQMMMLKKIPNIGNKRIMPLISKAIGNLNEDIKKYADFASETLPILKDDARVFGKLHHFAFTKDEKEKLVKNTKGTNLEGEYELLNKYFSNKKTITDKMTAFDFNIWLTDDILMKVDKTTMASALEARAPFLEPRLVDYALNMESEQRMGKKILKETFKDLLPKEILNRKKHGFNVPVSEWFGKKDVRSMSQEMFEYLENEKVFNKIEMNSILKNYKKYRHDQQLWNIITFGHWHKIFINAYNS